jgi:flagellar export protein FliJ
LLAARKTVALCAQDYTAAQQREEAVLALRESKYGEWRRAVLRAEQATLDEVGQRKNPDFLR